MMLGKRAAAVWLMAMPIFLVACAKVPGPRPLLAGRLGTVAVWAAIGQPRAFVFVFSGEEGWTPPLDAAAIELSRQAVAVVAVDLRRYLAELRASDDGCHYLISELEDLSKRLQREAKVEHYLSPILAGVGAGGTLAYAALAQSPAATVAGAVSVDPTPILQTKVPLCPGAPAEADPRGGFEYGPAPHLPGWWRLSTSGALAPAVAALAMKQDRDLDVASAPAVRLARLVTATLGIAEPTRLDLPIVEIPAEPRHGTLAIIYSGDGGWRDIAAHGIPVVGVDSLRYFWRRKEPGQIAADLERIIDRYRTDWRVQRVLLAGYSFGADVLPFAVNRLSDTTRARIVQISLLAPSPSALFEIVLTDWLGPDTPGVPLLPEVRRLPLDRVQCLYGEDDEDTLCTAPELEPTERIRTSGSHHFDGDYAFLAERLRAGLLRRAAERPPTS
jgi:type IV secretory pathway VirJ component